MYILKVFAGELNIHAPFLRHLPSAEGHLQGWRVNSKIWPHTNAGSRNTSNEELSGPVLRDTARLSQRYPPIARYGVFVASTWSIGCDTPSPFSEHFRLESMRSGGAIPPLKRGISAILARYPMKTRQMGAIPPSAILSRKRIARYGGVSRTGPLRWGGLLTLKEAEHSCPNFKVFFLDTPTNEGQNLRRFSGRLKIRSKILGGFLDTSKFSTRI